MGACVACRKWGRDPHAARGVRPRQEGPGRPGRLGWGAGGLHSWGPWGRSACPARVGPTPHAAEGRADPEPTVAGGASGEPRVPSSSGRSARCSWLSTGSAWSLGPRFRAGRVVGRRPVIPGPRRSRRLWKRSRQRVVVGNAVVCNDAPAAWESQVTRDRLELCAVCSTTVAPPRRTSGSWGGPGQRGPRSPARTGTRVKTPGACPGGALILKGKRVAAAHTSLARVPRGKKARCLARS